MKQRILVLVLILLIEVVHAQKNVQNPGTDYSSIDKIALQIPDSLSRTTENIAKYVSANFKSKDERARAIFIWTVTNIEYDIENMFAINFYEKRQDKINRSLKTRKGNCENYAALFNDICL